MIYRLRGQILSGYWTAPYVSSLLRIKDSNDIFCLAACRVVESVPLLKSIDSRVIFGLDACRRDILSASLRAINSSSVDWLLLYRWFEEWRLFSNIDFSNNLLIILITLTLFFINILQDPSFSCYSTEVSHFTLFSYCFGILRIVCIIVNFFFQTTYFWFQTDGQTDGQIDGRTDGQTDRRNKHILGLPS